MTPVLVAALLALARVVWPSRTVGVSTEPSRATWASAPGPTVPRRIAGILARLRQRDLAGDLAADAAYCEMLALALRAGLSPPDALAIADPGGRGRPDHDGPDAPAGPGVPARGGRLLRLAWAQSEALGTPLAEAVSACAAARQADHDHELRRGAANAGPRASMLLLTALPVLGPVLAAVVGLGPDLADPVVVVMLAAGFGATAFGWWWARRLVARADRPVRVARAPVP
jgi:tight adherence protein B